MSDPLFSIITATFNRAPLLREAIASVEAQGRDDVEHLIIDGASTDGTRELLAAHPKLRMLSEPDRGLYDAFNKGLALARGEYIGILNSDDLYTPGTLARAAESVAPGVQVVSGGADLFDDDRIVLEAVTADDVALTVRNVLANVPLLNSRFYHRPFVQAVGAFDLEYRIASDREWLLRAALANPVEVRVPELFYRYRQHHGSLTLHGTDRNVIAFREEHATFAEKHLARPGLAADARRELRRFHTRETSTIAAHHWKHGRHAQAREWMRRGRAQNRLWLLAFVRRLAGQALGR